MAANLNVYQKFDGVEKFARLNEVPSLDVPDGECYTYPMHAVYYHEGIIKQTRSGPNWQGGALTLTTCKHNQRAARPPEGWVGVWFAGFMPRMDGRNYLLYLARVKAAFETNYELGHALPRKTRFAKFAHLNPLGDIFEPKRPLATAAARMNPKNYFEPVGHVRWADDDLHDTWHVDIEHGPSKRPSATLWMGDVFLFSKPMLYSSRDLYRSGYKTTVHEFISKGLTKGTPP